MAPTSCDDPADWKRSGSQDGCKWVAEDRGSRCGESDSEGEVFDASFLFRRPLPVKPLFRRKLAPPPLRHFSYDASALGVSAFVGCPCGCAEGGGMMDDENEDSEEEDEDEEKEKDEDEDEDEED